MLFILLFVLSFRKWYSIALCRSVVRCNHFGSIHKSKHTYSMAIPICSLFLLLLLLVQWDFLIQIAMWHSMGKSGCFSFHWRFQFRCRFVCVLLVCTFQLYNSSCFNYTTVVVTQATCAMYKCIYIHIKTVHMLRFSSSFCFACICTNT